MLQQCVTNLPDVVERVDLWGEAAVNAEELLVHEGGEREAVECLHASVVHPFRVLDFACNERTNDIINEMMRQTERKSKEDKRNSHSCLKVKYSVKCLHSWLPRNRYSVVGWQIFNAHKYNTHCCARHTDANRKQQQQKQEIVNNSNSVRFAR